MWVYSLPVTQNVHMIHAAYQIFQVLENLIFYSDLSYCCIWCRWEEGITGYFFGISSFSRKQKKNLPDIFCFKMNSTKAFVRWGYLSCSWVSRIMEGIKQKRSSLLAHTKFSNLKRFVDIRDNTLAATLVNITVFPGLRNITLQNHKIFVNFGPLSHLREAV